MKKITYLLLFTIILTGFVTSKSDIKNHSNQNDSIESVIEIAKAEISNHIKKHGINPNNKLMIFDAYVQTNFNDKVGGCAMFHSQEGYDFVNENVRIGSNFVLALIIDDQGNYIARSSNHNLIKNPDQLNDYSLEIKMIELALSKNYITFIKLLNCNEDYIIGYKKGKVDVYRIVEDELIFEYSK